MLPNVLLIVMDCIRAENTSLHGYYRNTTPEITSLANEAIHYTQARAPGNWTTPSHMSMFTGFEVPELGADSSKSYRLPQGHTFWEDLNEENNYATGIFSENPNLTRLNNGIPAAFQDVIGPLDLPFKNALDPRDYIDKDGVHFTEWLGSVYQHNYTTKSLANGGVAFVRSKYPGIFPETLQSRATAETYVNAFLDWQAEQEGPWAACVNLMDAHEPYRSKDGRWNDSLLRNIYKNTNDTIWGFYGGEYPWWRREAFVNLYDNEIANVDQAVGRLVTELECRDVLKNTLLIVTSDHGECFGERSLVREYLRLAEHAIGIPEALVHVPLVVRLPDRLSQKSRLEAGSTVDEPVSLSELPALINDAIQGKASPSSLLNDSPVITAATVTEASVASEIDKYNLQAEDYCGDMGALYRKREGSVEKHQFWNDSFAAIELYDHEYGRRLSEADSTAVKEVFDKFQNTSIVTDVQEEIDQHTRNQLYELGYL